MKIEYIPCNELGLLLDDDAGHGFTLTDAAYFYIPTLFTAARAYDKEALAGDAAAKDKQEKLTAFGNDQLKKFTEYVTTWIALNARTATPMPT